MSWEETLRRHATKSQAAEYGAEMMRQWFKPLDLLPQVTEHRMAETMSLAAMVDLVIQVSELAQADPAETGTNHSPH